MHIFQLYLGIYEQDIFKNRVTRCDYLILLFSTRLFTIFTPIYKYKSHVPQFLFFQEYVTPWDMIL